MQKIFISLLLIFSTACHADWKVEKSKNFKGDSETFLVAKTLNDGTELWIDLQQKFAVIRNNRKTFNKVNGVKLDDVFYDVKGFASGDKFEYATFCHDSIDRDCYKNIFSAKKIEINVDYFRKGESVSKFIVNGSSETFEKFYDDGCNEKTLELKSEVSRRYRNMPTLRELSLESWLKENCGK